MRRHFRTGLFFFLALIFIISMERFSSKEPIDDEHHLSQRENSEPKMALLTSPLTKKQRTPLMIPLYDAGDLIFDNPEEKTRAAKLLVERKSIPKDKPTIKPHDPTPPIKQQAEPPQINTANTAGDRPTLEVAYESIGFDRYLDIIERVGRLFVLIDMPNGPRLGPEVSLKSQHLYRARGDLSLLATGRPHLISDIRIQQRLKSIEMPDRAHSDNVALILTKPFDAVLWETVSTALARHGLTLEEVSRVSGEYQENTKGVFLKFESISIRKSGAVVNLNDKLLVSL